MALDEQNRARDPLFHRRRRKPPMLNDPSADADDHWYGEGHPPVDPSAEGQDERQDWQARGYHMEGAPCDDVPPVTDDSYDGYEVPEELPQVSPTLPVDAFTDDPPGTEQPDASGLPERVPASVPEPPAEGQGETPAEEAPVPPAPPVSGPIPPVRKGRALKAALIPLSLLILLAAAAALVLNMFFRIDTIVVEGNSTFSTEEIVQASGLSVGQTVFQVDEDRIKKNIEQHSWLLYVVRVEVGEGSVTIHVHERTAVAYTHCRAIWYTLDTQGMALQQYSLEDELTDLILVDGLMLEHCDAGRRILQDDPEKLDIYVQLMLEISAMGLQKDIRKLELGDLEDLALWTRDGYYVRLGDTTYLHGKLKSMSLVLVELRGNKSYAKGGTIDVSTREYPTYSPPDI